ncbi:MAG: hypothetical protein J1E28_05560 [Helicobacter sp.]|uniref:hypothetical protein n=1 Tax=Helicobacter sp. TaxID=218 RepID=UPI0025C575D4|nr:hypothetical protein [Helicobacter sp.]MCH5313840.1 hypothetical protein [Helicobacter sp.]
MDNDFRIDYAIKNFVWFLVFAAICAFCIANFLVPQITEYKKQTLENRKTRIAFNQANKDYLDIEAQLKTFSIQNHRLLASLHHQSDEAKLLELLQTRFNAVEIKKLSDNKEQDIIDTRYEIIGYAPDTQSIEDFISWANTIPYFVKVDLPLKMEFDEKSKQIYFILFLIVKYSVYTEHPIILDDHLKFDYFKP